MITIPVEISVSNVVIPVDLSTDNVVIPVDISAGYIDAPAYGDYELLKNKPSIEGVPLIGDQTFAQLTLVRITNTEIENLLTI